MKPIYEITESDGTKAIKRTDPDGSIWSIPMVESNSDYQRYLEQAANEAKTK